MSHFPLSRTIQNAIRILLFGVGAGALFPILSRQWNDPVAITNGLVIGFFGSLFIIFFEFIYENPLNRKMRFAQKVILKSTAYTLYFALLIPIVISFTRSIATNKTFLSYLSEDFVNVYLVHGGYFTRVFYALVFCSAVIFTYQLSLKMGPGILWNFISGKYHRAREEDRIFMFLDLKSSTSIAEKLGEVDYNNFLNAFFFDITSSIVTTYGEIYRYVGDEVVVTWSVRKGLENANCVRTFFLANQAIRKQREKYLINFGIVPEFTAGYHSGKVIIGEIGDVKSQIVFNGEVLYTTGMIEKQCRPTKSKMLISEQLIKRISLPVIYDIKKVITLSAETEKKINLYEIKEIELANS